MPPWILNQELGFAFQVVSWRCIFFIIIFLYMLLVSHVEEEESWSCCRASLQGVEGKHFKYNLLICFAFFFFFFRKIQILSISLEKLPSAWGVVGLSETLAGCVISCLHLQCYPWLYCSPRYRISGSQGCPWASLWDPAGWGNRGSGLHLLHCFCWVSPTTHGTEPHTLRCGKGNPVKGLYGTRAAES